MVGSENCKNISMTGVSGRVVDKVGKVVSNQVAKALYVMPKNLHVCMIKYSNALSLITVVSHVVNLISAIGWLGPYLLSLL